MNTTLSCFYLVAAAYAVISCTGDVTAAAAQGPARVVAVPGNQPGPSGTTIFQVSSRMELQPATPDEKATATAFDKHGTERMEPGHPVVLFPDTPAPPPPPGTARPRYEDFVARLGCTGSTMVTGTVTPTRVRFNTRETFLYTEFQVSIAHWIRPAGGVPSIRLAQAGGSVAVAGQRMDAVTNAVLFEPGATYLLVLNAIPGASAFVLAYPPVRDKPLWAGDLPNVHLPVELATHAISFPRFVKDVGGAALRCTSSR